MDDGLGQRGVGIKLHGIGLDAPDCLPVRGEAAMRNLCEHGVGQVLHHDGHPVGLGPAEAEQRTSLSLASLERDTGSA